MSIRVYPIRFTRKSWHIGLYTKHECNHSCNYTLIKDRNSKKFLCRTVGCDCQSEEPPDCKRAENIENTIISIKDFDIRRPTGFLGPLHLANNIVIPQKEFFMILHFPMRSKLKITVNEPLGDGFTLKEVLYAIKLSYEDIYRTEDETSSSNMYIIMSKCHDCSHINLKKYINPEDFNKDKLTEDRTECAICKDELINATDSQPVKLQECDHYFHKECIDNWIDANGKTCPLCRTSLKNCSECDATGYTAIYHEGVSLPQEYRGTEPRIHTNGVYGIYDYYLDDLYINSLDYNNETNELSVTIQTV